MGRQVIYFMMSEFPDGLSVKIGQSKNVRQRLKTIQLSTPSPVVLVFAFHGCKECEGLLHRHFKADVIRSEWFRYTPRMDTVKRKIMNKLGCVMEDMKFEVLFQLLKTMPKLLTPANGE